MTQQRSTNNTKHVHRKNEKLATFGGLETLGWQMIDKIRLYRGYISHTWYSECDWTKSDLRSEIGWVKLALWGEQEF